MEQGTLCFFLRIQCIQWSTLIARVTAFSGIDGFFIASRQLAGFFERSCSSAVAWYPYRAHTLMAEWDNFHASAIAADIPTRVRWPFGRMGHKFYKSAVESAGIPWKFHYSFLELGEWSVDTFGRSCLVRKCLPDVTVPSSSCRIFWSHLLRKKRIQNCSVAEITIISRPTIIRRVEFDMINTAGQSWMKQKHGSSGAFKLPKVLQFDRDNLNASGRGYIRTINPDSGDIWLYVR